MALKTWRHVLLTHPVTNTTRKDLVSAGRIIMIIHETVYPAKIPMGLVLILRLLVLRLPVQGTMIPGPMVR